MSVAQLSLYIKGVFDDEELLHDVTLVGEVADISYSDRHTFLVLADGVYSVRCVHFSSRDIIEKGARIAIRGSVGYYDKRNTVSFAYTDFFLHGVGDKNAKLAELKTKLAELGYFENRPKLPTYISKVVVITSPDGAAIRDFMRVVYDKNRFVDIRVYPVKVQGEGAAAQMTEAVNRLQKYNADAIVLCRGGGSDEDLDCFNDESLACAVARSQVPIISAVGHEINYSLCDFCAGTRAGTPSIAGEIVNAHAGKMLIDLVNLSNAIKLQVEARFGREVKRTSKSAISIERSVLSRMRAGYDRLRIGMQRGINAMQYKFNKQSNRLVVRTGKLRSAIAFKLSDRYTVLNGYKSLLKALDPHRIIKIGYAAAFRQKQRISTATELCVGDEINLVFADGTATANIKSVGVYAKSKE